MSTTARNVLIVLALAALVAFAPRGGDAAQVVARAVSMAFLGVLAFAGVWFYRSNRVTIESLDPGPRIALYGGVAGLVFAAAGYDWLTATSSRALLFMVIVAASVGALLLAWQRWREL